MLQYVAQESTDALKIDLQCDGEGPSLVSTLPGATLEMQEQARQGACGAPPHPGVRSAKDSGLSTARAPGKGAQNLACFKLKNRFPVQSRLMSLVRSIQSQCRPGTLIDLMSKLYSTEPSYWQHPNARDACAALRCSLDSATYVIRP